VTTHTPSGQWVRVKPGPDGRGGQRLRLDNNDIPLMPMTGNGDSAYGGTLPCVPLPREHSPLAMEHQARQAHRGVTAPSIHMRNRPSRPRSALVRIVLGKSTQPYPAVRQAFPRDEAAPVCEPQPGQEPQARRLRGSRARRSCRWPIGRGLVPQVSGLCAWRRAATALTFMANA
jgi:hypothetical protein